MTPAQEWGRALKRVMEERGASINGTARAAGIAESTLRAILAERSFPFTGTAYALAETLDAPSLATLVDRLQAKVCAVCKRKVVALTSRRVYCSVRCRHVAQHRRRKNGRESIAHLARKRLALYMETVDAYCRGCEPLGRCRTPDCPIKVADLSPLPLARRAVA